MEALNKLKQHELTALANGLRAIKRYGLDLTPQQEDTLILVEEAVKEKGMMSSR